MIPVGTFPWDSMQKGVSIAPSLCWRFGPGLIAGAAFANRTESCECVRSDLQCCQCKFSSSLVFIRAPVTCMKTVCETQSEAVTDHKGPSLSNSQSGFVARGQLLDQIKHLRGADFPWRQDLGARNETARGRPSLHFCTRLSAIPRLAPVASLLSTSFFSVVFS
jgi:hypothetical protein